MTAHDWRQIGRLTLDAYLAAFAPTSVRHRRDVPRHSVWSCVAGQSQDGGNDGVG
jgi:hypothetical protein